MKDPEERLRRAAVRRVLAGAAAAEVAAELHRSERWVFKWLARYDPNDEAWARAESRAPRAVANKTVPEVEALILEVRERLQADPWAQIGATAIAWELRKLGMRSVPASWTIERVLQRAGVPRRPRLERPSPKGTPYPAAPALLQNACQEGDLIGPRHLVGAVPFFVLNVVDLARRAAGCELQLSKADAPTANAVIHIWDAWASRSASSSTTGWSPPTTGACPWSFGCASTSGSRRSMSSWFRSSRAAAASASL